MMTNSKAPEREDIETLLPWFAAGTLSRRDAARVEEALANDNELSRQFEMVREELGETIRLNESLGAPSARAMARLFEKIDAEPARKPSAVSGFASRMSEFFGSLSPRTLAWSGAAAALAIVLQAGIITGVLMQDRAHEGTFRTVSYEAGAPAAAQGTFALIRFAPQASAADIEKFLHDNKFAIVDGPNGGLYRVRVAVTGLPKDELARIVKQLQDNKSVGLALPAQQ
jgi:anti-sigma factor RsiW